MTKVTDKLTALVECKEVPHLSFDERQSFIDMHLTELDKLGVSVVNTGLFANDCFNKAGFPKVLVPDTDKPFSGNDVLLLDGDGGVIAGQKDLTINASFEGATTATVTFVIGGFVTKGGENG